MPSAGGYLLLVMGIDECPDDITRLFAGTLPNITDRYRSSGHRFEAVLVTRSVREVVVQILRAENIRLDEFGRLPGTAPDTQAVPVYVDGQLTS